MFNQSLIGDINHLRNIVRPEAILFFQLTKQIRSFIFNHIFAAKIDKKNEIAKISTGILMFES